VSAAERREPLVAWTVSALFLGAILWPMAQTPPRDSFPLSTFPMFARARPPVVDIDHLVAVGNAGQRRIVPPQLVVRGEVLQSKALIDATVRRGRRASLELCRAVAARLAEDPGWSNVVRLELRRDRFDVLAYFAGERTPLQQRVHARCRVPR
jgi:hypothetical protein